MINYSSSIKISQLSVEPTSSVTLDDFFPIVDSGSLTTYRISIGNLKTAMFNSANISADKNIIFQSGSALTASNNLKFDYTTNTLSVLNSIQTTSVTASLNGTASYSNTASFALTASVVLSSNSTFALTSSYVSGSQGILTNLYLNVNGQKTAPFYHGGSDSGSIYFISTTPNSASFAEIYLAPSGSLRGKIDYANNVGLWLNGGNAAFPTYSLPIYLGGNPQNSSPTPSLTVASNGNVGIGTMTPSATLHVNGPISSSAITSSLNGTASWATNAINSISSANSQTSSYINYIGASTGTGSYSLTASYASGSGVTALTASYSYTASYINPNTSFVKGFAMVTGSNASVKGTDQLSIVSVYNIAYITPLGSLRVYAGGTGTQFCWGVTFANPVSSTNYIVIGNGWETANSNGGENAAVFLPHTASILNNRTTTAFTMSAQGDWDGTGGETWGMNFQVLGY